MTEVLVIGVGSPDAGDDAVGALVAQSVANRALPGVEVALHEDPTDLALLWRDRSRVIVVDAIRSGAPPGSIVLLDADDEADATRWPSGRCCGTHDFGVATAIGLSRALGTLPADLTVVGVEGVEFTPGGSLSDEVRDAVGAAADEVARLTGVTT